MYICINRSFLYFCGKKRIEIFHSTQFHTLFLLHEGDKSTRIALELDKYEIYFTFSLKLPSSC